LILGCITFRTRTAPSVISPALLPLCDSQIGQVANAPPQATNLKTNRWNVRREQGAGREPKEGQMLQSSENSFLKSGTPASNPNTFNPVKTVTAPVDQATIGRTLVIKGEISGSEALYIDGRIEGKIIMPESRVTIGRNGKVDASIQAREVVVMGKVTGNIECSDRVDIRAEGSVSGDISTVRISVEDGAALRGGIQVRSDGKVNQSQNQTKPETKALAATASA
jgi:cytoskeletal protein CcmA (bactofilin family)